MPCCIRYLVALSLVATLSAPPSFAYQAVLSDQAVREAYFLGQRHDESLSQFLDKYAQHLLAPKSGPYISSISFSDPIRTACRTLQQPHGRL